MSRNPTYRRIGRVAPRRERASSENLDSLLDTMANVVGILIVLMAVTQLTVGDAMERIRALDSTEGHALTREHDELAGKLASLQTTHGENAQGFERLATKLRALLGDSAAARIRTTAATTASTVAARAAQVRRLERANSEKRERLTSLRVRMTEQEKRDQPTAELRLPDPRPAPPRADRVVFLARYEHVLEPKLDTLESELNEVVRAWAEAGNTIRGFGARALVEHVRERELGNQWLRWQLVETSGKLIAQLHWRDTEAGDDLTSLPQPQAAFRRRLAELDPSRHYVRFWVWGDSFEVYLEARRIAEAAGFAVGWEAIPIGGPLQASFGQPMRPAAPVD